jgi:hypothetical protein
VTGWELILVRYSAIFLLQRLVRAACPSLRLSSVLLQPIMPGPKFAESAPVHTIIKQAMNYETHCFIGQPNPGIARSS